MDHFRKVSLVVVLTGGMLVAGLAFGARPDTVTPTPILSSCSGDLDGDGRSETAIMFKGPHSRTTNITIIDSSTVSIVYYDQPALEPDQTTVLVCKGGHLMWGFPQSDPWGEWTWNGRQYVYRDLW
jgi:hypothetical protein